MNTEVAKKVGEVIENAAYRYRQEDLSGYTFVECVGREFWIALGDKQCPIMQEVEVYVTLCDMGFTPLESMKP